MLRKKRQDMDTEKFLDSMEEFRAIGDSTRGRFKRKTVVQKSMESMTVDVFLDDDMTLDDLESRPIEFLRMWGAVGMNGLMWLGPRSV